MPNTLLIPTPTTGLKPLERLELPAHSPARASNRNSDGPCQIDAHNDLEAVDSWLRRVKDSPQTFRSYRKEIERLLLWAQGQGRTIGDLNADDLSRYKDFLADPQPAHHWCGPRLSREHDDWKPFEGPLKPRSINQALVIIGSAFSYWTAAGYLRGNPMALVNKKRLGQQIRGGKTVERYLELDLWRYLWRFITSLPAETPAQRNHAERVRFLFALLYLQSPRVSEVAGHRMGDFIELRGRWWWRITGKGNKTERIPVKTDMLKALARYRRHLGLPPLPQPDEDTPLVCSLGGKAPISADMVYRLVKQTCAAAADDLALISPQKAAWLRRASTHWMRHTSLTHQAERGVNLRYLQASARHASIETTQRYLHTEEDSWHKAMNASGLD